MPVLKITDLYTNYFQKSKVFLYPILGLRSSSIVPVETYIAWEGMFTTDDYKLACIFHLREDSEFISFEENVLLKNPYFIDYKELSIDKGVYTFDLSDFKEDFDALIQGKYSHLSEDTKKKIRQRYGSNSHNYAFINSFLYPDEYFSVYAKLLTVDPGDIPAMHRLLVEVGELCDKPDLYKENLKSKVKVLDLG